MKEKITIHSIEGISSDIAEENLLELNSIGYFVNHEKGTVFKAYASMDFFVPAILTFVLSSYLGGFIKEIGSQHAKNVLKVISNSYTKLCKKTVKKVTSSSKISDRQVNLIAFDVRIEEHDFIGRFVLPNGLNKEDVKHALSLLSCEADKMENYLLGKKKLFEELGKLRESNPYLFNQKVKEMGYMEWSMTVVYYSKSEKRWINAEKLQYEMKNNFKQRN